MLDRRDQSDRSRSRSPRPVSKRGRRRHRSSSSDEEERRIKEKRRLTRRRSRSRSSSHERSRSKKKEIKTTEKRRKRRRDSSGSSVRTDPSVSLSPRRSEERRRGRKETVTKASSSRSSLSSSSSPSPRRRRKGVVRSSVPQSEQLAETGSPSSSSFSRQQKKEISKDEESSGGLPSKQVSEDKTHSRDSSVEKKNVSKKDDPKSTPFLQSSSLDPPPTDCTDSRTTGDANHSPREGGHTSPRRRTTDSASHESPQETNEQKTSDSSSSSFLFRKRGGFNFSSGLARLKALNEEESYMYADEVSFHPSNGSAYTPGVSKSSACSLSKKVGKEGKEAILPVERKESDRSQLEEEAEEEEETLVVLKSMKELQKVRQIQHRRGLDIVGLQESEKTNQGGGEGEEEDGLAGYGLLERSFSAVNSTSATGVTIDKHLEEFLRERMQLKDPKKEEKEKKDEVIVDPSVQASQELYRVPEGLQVADRSHAYKDQLNWLTGLTEVQLPMSMKLKNIEATEKAKRSLLKKGEPGAVQEDEDPDAIRRKALGQRYTWYDPEKFRRARPGDDKALQNFSQQARRAQQNRGRVGIGYG
ncbi:hepatocellular carcinoma-associated antigen 59 [Cystoisospora suis]|uniref:Hepatocellular carcinoma-associated antigen 59 n=1 Tax=Cystoisospora suis TaxID=483139 RepID=A0A2C6L7V0_9APIC|nr:hepatocellular carcinoma-associated antigen 59 [Cystoisospora suis]